MSSIRRGNREPTADGDVNQYDSPELSSKAYFNRSGRALFVNGMGNSPGDHKRSAEVLSGLQACPVVGVYNKTDGFWLDLGQCLQDKLTLVGAQSESLTSFAGWVTLCDQGYRSAKDEDRNLTKEKYVEGLIKSNQATLALYRLLLSPELGPDVPIFAHSQGNLVTSNALTAVALARGEAAIAGTTVNSFGSPCRFWPPGIDHRNHAFTFDPVGWMDYKFSFESIKVGGIVAHGFVTYMNSDPEYVVNRFRWGSFGFTANMDEQGLADAMIGMSNPDRVHRIFQRLQQAHWSDKDDVALLYVRGMRQRGQEGTLRQMARSHPALIREVIECLVGGVGWNTAEEKKEAAFLESLS